jgi:hypothetical protein
MYAHPPTHANKQSQTHILRLSEVLLEVVVAGVDEQKKKKKNYWQQ